MSRPLAHVLFWMAAAACILAELAIIRAALATHPHQLAEPAERVPQPSRAGEIIWVIIPAVILALVLWATWRALP